MGIRARTRARALVRIEKGGMSQDTPPKERKMKWLFLANSLGIKEKARHFRTRRFHVSSRRKIHPNTPFTNTKSGSDLIENGGAYRTRTGDLYTARSDNLFALCAVFNGRIYRQYGIKTAYISVFSLYHSSKSCYNEVIQIYRIHNNFVIIIHIKHRIKYAL